ncbi:MAG: hypothetical protein KGZ58_04425 [Ignavibacteriales bacterium]|nr:hypothetical protein [Ignavibacteriales bacterium]
MEIRDEFANVIKRFDELNIQYMLTGSVASSFWGSPRTSHDFDFIIVLSQKDTRRIYSAFQSDYYVSSIEDAIKHNQMFNIIPNNSSMKIDCWILKRDEFNLSAFQRKRKVTLYGIDAFVISPEDSIISKLLWYVEYPNEIQLRDIGGIIETQQHSIDFIYISQWCERLSLNELWNSIKTKHKFQ